MHGSPRSDVEYLLEDVRAGRLSPTDPVRLRQRLGEVSAGVVLCGHSHQARIVPCKDDVLIVNPGSVHCPTYLDARPLANVSEAGSPRARDALLQQAAAAWQIDRVAVAHDWAAASRRAAENGRDETARALAGGLLAPPKAKAREPRKKQSDPLSRAPANPAFVLANSALARACNNGIGGMRQPHGDHVRSRLGEDTFGANLALPNWQVRRRTLGGP